MTQPALLEQPRPGTTRPGLVHLVCCLAPDIAFCGTDREGQPFTTRDATCVVCIDINDTVGCPHRAVCPHETDT